MTAPTDTEHAEQPNLTVMRHGTVHLDDSPDFPCIYDPHLRWNGFVAEPWFTDSTMHTIATMLGRWSADGHEVETLHPSGDDWWLHDPETSTSARVPTRTFVDGARWSPGSHGWVWSDH